jgi:hypothetical protein
MGFYLRLDGARIEGLTFDEADAILPEQTVEALGACRRSTCTVPSWRRACFRTRCLWRFEQQAEED